MNILYLIGNGFDINLGLKTGYSDFYDYYLSQGTKSEVVAKLKTHLEKERYTTWADLELGMGEYTKNVSDCHDLEIICHDLSRSLRLYLSKVQSGFAVTPVDIDKFKGNLLNPSRGLNAGSRRSVDSYVSLDKDIFIINFNYTNTVERLCNYKGSSIQLSQRGSLQMIQHIHMSLDNSDVILGVNDENQIANKELICPELEDIMIKPHINKQLGTLVDDECMSLIDNSNLICLFGVSLGESDNIWWKRIGNRMLQSNARLIYYAYDKDNPQFNNELIGKRRFYMDLIKVRCQFSKENTEVESRIFIGYKTDFFKIR